MNYNQVRDLTLALEALETWTKSYQRELVKDGAEYENMQAMNAAEVNMDEQKERIFQLFTAVKG